MYVLLDSIVCLQCGYSSAQVLVLDRKKKGFNASINSLINLRDDSVRDYQSRRSSSKAYLDLQLQKVYIRSEYT